jgi:3-methyladenine DNA glycosylase AlkD
MSEPPRKKAKLSQANMTIINKLESAFRAAANVERAMGQKKYMRNQFEFIGLTSPERRSLQKGVMKQHPIGSIEELIATTEKLWELEERDFAHAGIDLLLFHKSLWTSSTLENFKFFVSTESWWDTVDTLASNCVGSLLQTYPELKPKMRDWITDDCLWVRRVAILHQLKYKTKTDESVLFDFCKQTMHEKDFFIRKAIGWALREYSKTSTEAVRDFIEQNKNQLSPLSIREGSKYI